MGLFNDVNKSTTNITGGCVPDLFSNPAGFYCCNDCGKKFFHSGIFLLELKAKCPKCKSINVARFQMGLVN